MPSFVLSPPKNTWNGEVVILIHGLAMRSVTMGFIGLYLRRLGYRVYFYDYFTFSRPIAGHARAFAAFLEKVVAATPDAQAFHVVSHSLGGIVTRAALAIYCPRRLRRVVMLAPPNSGSAMARRLSKITLLRWLIKPLWELSDAPDSPIHRIPIPEGIEIGVIAAVRGDGKGWKAYMEGDDDGKVALKDTFLKGQKDHVVIRSRHSILLARRGARELVAAFLRAGRFPR